MAIKLADTARPNNYIDAEHLGTYPVAYAEDVWFEDGTRLSEKTFGGIVATINYAKTQNYCYRVTTTGVGVDIPFDEIESYSDGNYSARIHVRVARKTNNSGDLYYKTFIDIPIAKGTDPNTGLTIKSYGFIPDWSQEPTSSPSSEGRYNNGIEVILQRGTYDGAERDVIGMWYNYSVFGSSKKIVVYMPTKVGFITNSQVATYIEKIQIFKLA